MDMQKLEPKLSELVDHMSRAGYTEHYVGAARRLAGLVIAHGEQWDGWDDARRWLSGRRGGDHLMPLLTAMGRYDELGILPRTDGAEPRRKPGARDSLGAGFAEVVDAYERVALESKKPSTVRKEASNAASFLSRLASLGPKSPCEATEDDVLAVLTAPDGGPAYSASHVSKVRIVLRTAAEAGVEGCAALASWLPVPRKWRKVGPCITEKEAASIDAALGDPSSALTLRDRAIGRLLLHTGMRPSDVAAMRTGSVRWEADEISIAQQKTGSPLTLPLTPKVGNAIFDYVTEERGANADAHLFVSTKWPFGGLTASSVYKTSCAVLDAAGVRCGDGDARGARLFRRRAATAMLGGGIDRAVAASVLGHTDAKTTERYMQADVEGLRAHASLDVSRFSGADEGVVR